MINVIVSYTVKPAFVAENQENIREFLEDFRSLDTSTFSYRVFLNSDNVTFTHVSNYRDEQVQREVLNVPSFLAFQKKRDDSGLEGSHQVQVLQHIGSTHDGL